MTRGLQALRTGPELPTLKWLNGLKIQDCRIEPEDRWVVENAESGCPDRNVQQSIIRQMGAGSVSQRRHTAHILLRCFLTYADLGSSVISPQHI
jgi:hypothetical protein